MQLHYFAIWVGVLPFLAVHTSYLLSAWQGHVDWCIPYLHGCTSISAAGRHGAAYFIFKGVMIPSAVLMGVYWWFHNRWLYLIGGNCPITRRVIAGLGITASVALIVYCCVLGSVGEAYVTARRIGVSTYFGLTFLAQLLMTRQIQRLGIAQLQSTYYCKLGLGLAMLTVGLSHIMLGFFTTPGEHIEDIVEWNFALLMILYYISSHVLWRYKAVRVDLSFNKTA